ncbi:hypothetical protein CU103_30070 [Phyllobacterium sophorae]|uniref:Uncharacterized protein n=1 Tax=Phyllobacterium sophorae TaxID=1520277 RepID=A0A2P7AQ74_9HYPH|nr:hypothetical protein CU103_30070 [Phyllobacterium sophorae]
MPNEKEGEITSHRQFNEPKLQRECGVGTQPNWILRQTTTIFEIVPDKGALALICVLESDANAKF